MSTKKDTNIFDKDAVEVSVEQPAPVIDMEALKAEMRLDMLKAQADELTIAYHPAIGADKLQAKIAATIIANAAPPEPVEEVKPFVESPAVIKARLRKDAMRLVRVIVNCMNPAKLAVEAEYLTAGNSVIGSVTRLVPFNLEEGTHIEHILYEQLRDRMCQTFRIVKDRATGVETSKTIMIKEFNIIMLPQLTHEELKELARRQAAGHNID